MPTIRLFPSITGRRLIWCFSMSSRASSISLSSVHHVIPLVMTSRAVNLERSCPVATPRQTISRSVIMPMSRSFSPTGIAPMSSFCIFCAISINGVSGETQTTPLCIAFFTFMTSYSLYLLLHKYNFLSQLTTLMDVKVATITDADHDLVQEQSYCEVSGCLSSLKAERISSAASTTIALKLTRPKSLTLQPPELSNEVDPNLHSRR